MSLRLSTIGLLLALLPAGAGLRAEEATYTLDPVHTRVMFSASHAGFSNPMGTISGTTGTLVFDPDDWSKARVEAKIPLQRLELGDDKWNRAVLAKTFLDAEHHPEAIFVSTKVEPIDANHATVIGNLTLRGTTRPVRLDVVLHQVKRHPMPPYRRTAGFSATGKLSRALFGINAWPSVVGDEIEIRLEVEGARSRGADDNAAPPAPATTLPAPAATTMPAAPATSIPPTDATPA